MEEPERDGLDAGDHTDAVLAWRDLGVPRGLAGRADQDRSGEPLRLVRERAQRAPTAARHAGDVAAIGIDAVATLDVVEQLEQGLEWTAGGIAGEPGGAAPAVVGRTLRREHERRVSLLIRGLGPHPRSLAYLPAIVRALVAVAVEERDERIEARRRCVVAARHEQAIVDRRAFRVGEDAGLEVLDRDLGRGDRGHEEQSD